MDLELVGSEESSLVQLDDSSSRVSAVPTLEDTSDSCSFSESEVEKVLKRAFHISSKQLTSSLPSAGFLFVEKDEDNLDDSMKTEILIKEENQLNDDPLDYSNIFEVNNSIPNIAIQKMYSVNNLHVGKVSSTTGSNQTLNTSIHQSNTAKKSKIWKKKKNLTIEELNRKRDLANKQERRRMFRLNKALEELRKVIPAKYLNHHPSRRLSKIKTLRHAINYIQDLTDCLHEDNLSQ